VVGAPAADGVSGGFAVDQDIAEAVQNILSYRDFQRGFEVVPEAGEERSLRILRSAAFWRFVRHDGTTARFGAEVE